ncbi:tripartite motif-containing protein 16-like [Acanthochromis polyacanthus]|uniref:tripartite motif-containing protein 16-like n=1 Tax=Acanthochromis polyacanthus TaxID=80966 RepID=UPI002234AFB9|nr:tripartite motif-containing protein 16-like [Acanthochromis polyacanthus]
MAQQRNQSDSKKFSCSICLDLLKDPVTTSCGHNYCMDCIKTHWDGEDGKRIYSCPQCGKIFTPRPVLEKNVLFAELVEDLKKTGLQAAADDHCYAGPEDVDEHKGHETVPAAAERKKKPKELEVSRLNIQQRIQDRQRDVKLLQQELENINVSAHKTVDDSEKMFIQMIHLIQKRGRDVEQQIRSQQETEVSRIKELQEKLEQEIRDLKRKDAELKQLSDTPDHNHFLLNYPSVSALSESTHSSSFNIRPLRHFENVTAAVKELRDLLQDILRDTWTNISLAIAGRDVSLSGPQPEPKPEAEPEPEPEPKTRVEFLKYSTEITLDPNTAHRRLLLCEDNRKAIASSLQRSPPDHLDRFTDYHQVLSQESLTGRCYWEMECSYGEVSVAVAYKNICRTGKSNECVFGRNNKSWSLSYDISSYIFWYDNTGTPVPGDQASRIGVYLDHRAGILSFYSVSKTMTLLHRVQTTFTEPIHAGVGFCSDFKGAEFLKLR